MNKSSKSSKSIATLTMRENQVEIFESKSLDKMEKETEAESCSDQSSIHESSPPKESRSHMHTLDETKSWASMTISQVLPAWDGATLFSTSSNAGSLGKVVVGCIVINYISAGYILLPSGEYNSINTNQ